MQQEKNETECQLSAERENNVLLQKQLELQANQTMKVKEKLTAAELLRQESQSQLDRLLAVHTEQTNQLRDALTQKDEQLTHKLAELEQLQLDVEELREENGMLRSSTDQRIQQLEDSNLELRLEIERLNLERSESRPALADLSNMAGHSNPKQRIKLHEQIKHENEKLRENNKNLLVQIQKLKLAMRRDDSSSNKENRLP
eukprot:TRINITY_DN16314_c0_g2_i1.p1 TRINITY_DN16314_c0_g2~~TRINITY_DN16314_c0_g2_i1.p1  ORF type:complete len:201 (-),score=79.57 TRINITY_DN16314_c0_g2_i1:93-695(-)